MHVTLFDNFDGEDSGWDYGAPAMTADGRLWFSNVDAIQSIDPEHIPRNTLSPPVHIDMVQADGVTSMPSDHVQIAPKPHQVRISYSGLSFVVPQRVLFKYRLTGIDQEWVDAGNRREAFYDDLGPGRYKFQVVARNNDGVWNQTGDILTFDISSMWYQTLWFRGIVAIAITFGLWLLYQLRLAQATQLIQLRVTEREKERVRIARDLHDTLLQGFQAIILRMHSVAKRLPEADKQNLMNILDCGDEVLEEGRDRLESLRSGPTTIGDLQLAIEQLASDLSEVWPTTYKISADSTSQQLSPVIGDEVFQIAREALANAFRHAQASSIRVEIKMERRIFRLKVRDDGTGIESTVLESGRDRHWGLQGMRERAERIGGRLAINNIPGTGVEIHLSIAADRVHLAESPRSR
jgi:signal transduction histidine kinase